MAIGGTTVDELQGRMSHAEYLEWQAYDKNEPIGPARGDFQNALLMTLLATIHKSKGKRKPKITDFLPDWWEDRKRPAALAAKFRAITARTNNRANNSGNTGRQVGRRRGGL